MDQRPTRRDVLKHSAFAAAAAAVLGPGGGAALAADAPPKMPSIRLGTLEVSRLILGSNPFWGYAHKPGDVGRQMTEYFTDERIMAVMDEAAGYGVTTVTCPPDERWRDLWEKYRSNGGKLKVWVAQCHGDPRKMKEEITVAVKAGCQGVFIQGHRVEDAFLRKQYDMVRSWVDHSKSLNMPTGLAAHRQNVHPKAEELGFPTDFYFQCFFIPDTYKDEDREKAIATISQIKKPVVAYKILAAGRLPAREAFQCALSRIAAKDGICVGVFPKDQPNQVREDAQLAIELSKK